MKVLRFMKTKMQMMCGKTASSLPYRPCSTRPLPTTIPYLSNTRTAWSAVFLESERTGEKIAHSLWNYSWTAFQTPVDEPVNLQKFWQGIVSLLERILDSFFAVLLSNVANFVLSVCIDIGRIPRISRQKTKKCGEKFKKCRVLGPKTSDFLGTNLRTFDAKPPYFVAKKSDVSGFPAGNAAKSPCPRFCDISDQSRVWWLPRPFSGR